MYRKTYEWLEETCKQLDKWPDLQKMFKQCFVNTLETTTKALEDGSFFIFTGDIPAMWLRDSSCQVLHYLPLVTIDPDIQTLIRGLIKRQFDYILHDPYANAFNETANGAGHQDDKTDMSPLVWERKYEVDSLCFPMWLTYHYWQESQDHTIFDDRFLRVVETILSVWETEQDHWNQSAYRFERTNCYLPTDTLTNGGKGSKVGYTGMTWSGFRPSDDACTYHYLVPSNLFAVVVLGQIIEMVQTLDGTNGLIERAERLRSAIETGVKQYALVEHPRHGTIYAYEVDGLGHYVLMDDANYPSLLSLPFIGYCSIEDEIYQNTRRFILSRDNPYYYIGKSAQGIGSPHTPHNYVWHLSLIMQALTSNDQKEKRELLTTILNTHGGTYFMHESFDCNDPTAFTREWFAWANSMFALLIIRLLPELETLLEY